MADEPGFKAATERGSDAGAAHGPALPAAGSRIRQYEVGAEVGRGGMGVVLRGHDNNLKREVALKTLLPHLAGDQQARKRFLREARAASRLSHPNIVPVFETFEEGGFPWLVMPFIEGSSLRSVLRDGRRMEPEQVIRLGEDIATALQEAHARRVVHRDLTPGNVLLTPGGQALLVDFGLARFLPASGEGETSMISTLTATGEAVGTPGYMSPEQVLGKGIDGRSDLFSLGTLLYKACTGHGPFSGGGFAQVFGAILHLDPEPVSRYTREVPEEFERIIRKAMAKRPDERYQSAGGMLADLRALRRRHESGAVSHQSMGAIFVRRRRWPWVVVGLVAVTAAAVAVGLRMMPPGPYTEGVPRRLTGARGWESQPAMSPDGGTVAYVSNESGNPDVWIVDAQGGRPLQLTSDPGDDSQPAWFPDSSAIAFTSSRGGEARIWSIGRLGGEPVLLLPNATSPAISPDGKSIAFCRRHDNDARIFVAPLEDPDQAVRITGNEDGVWSHGNPVWSPDGETICFDDMDSLWLAEVASNRVVRLTNDEGGDMEPVFSSDGRSVLFSSGRQGTDAIWQVPSRGGEPARVTFGTGPEVNPSPSRDGRLLAYSTYHTQFDILLVNLVTGERHRIGDLSIDGEPGIAPDRSAVVFTSDRWENRKDLWIQPLVDSRPVGQPRKLTDQVGDENLPVFSPDGRWIAYHSNYGGQRDVAIVPAAGGRSIPFTSDPASDVNPDWAPDGRRLVFASDREGPSHLFVGLVEEGRRGFGDLVRLTDGDSSDFLPRWSPDGLQVAFVRFADQSWDVWILAVDGSAAPRRLTSGADVRILAWDASSGSLLVSGLWGGSSETLRSVDPVSGASQVFEIAGGIDPVQLFSLSRDGQLLVVEEETKTGDIWVFEGPEGVY